MKIFYYILIFFFIHVNNKQILSTPRYLIVGKYPFILPDSNNDNYYVFVSNNVLKINKSDGNIITKVHEFKYSNETIYCIFSDKAYLFDSQRFYYIDINENFNNIYIKLFNSNYYSGEYFGSIILNNIFAIYGKNSNKFVFLRKMIMGNEFIKYEYNIENIKKISCKFIENNYFLCAILINNEVKIYLLKYDFYQNYNNKCFCINYDIDNNEYSNLALYDTISAKTKILCKSYSNKIICNFVKITIYSSELISGNIENIEQPYLNFISCSNDFSEKDCNFSEFNNEYLFCCGITDYIICYRINKTSFNIIKQFNISIHQRNSYLSIITNNEWMILVFMNNEDKVYEYKIYIPHCNYTDYSFFDSLNENNNETTMERLINLFEVKTNNTFLTFPNAPYDFGYFILNQNIIINNSSKINIMNNDYSIDFIITNKEKVNFTNISINYTVSVEYSEAYTAQCQIKFNFLFSSQCYYSCSKCKNSESNASHHYCIKCNEGYYFLENTTNCYNMSLTEYGYYLDNLAYDERGKIEPIFKKCYESCKTCFGYKEIADNKEENHNCIECADYYYKLENGSYPYNCYDNETINSWNTLEDSIFNTINPINTIEIQQEIKSELKILNSEESHYIENYENISNSFTENNENEIIYEKLSTIYIYEKEISSIAKIFECGISCLICYENDKTNCIQCNKIKGYYPLYNNKSSCYNNETIIKGYYLDEKANPFIWKSCYEKCESCNIFITPDGDCVPTCPNGTYKIPLNNSCLNTCPDNYMIYNNECIHKLNEQEILISEFKNKILKDINSCIN